LDTLPAARVLKISLRSSWLLVTILTLAHIAALAVMLFVNIPLWVPLIAAAALAVHLLVVIRRQALLLTPDAAAAIEIRSDNTLAVQVRGGAWNEYAVLGNTYVSPYLTVLNLQQTDGHAVRRITLLPDSLDAEDFRKLRVWLRWKEARATT
jgi:toxin CptA